MAPVLISKPERSMEDGWSVVSASLTINGKTYQLKYRASEGPLASGSEPFLAATLVPAMRVGQPLQVSGIVSPKLLAAMQIIQEILHKWAPEFQKIAIQANSGLSEESGHATDVGVFFSGGVDAFYTFLKHQDEITKIILVHGFDMSLEKTSLRSKVSRKIRQLAQELGKPLIEVETNVRDLSLPYTEQKRNFVMHHAGSVLPSVGLLLSPQFKKIYMPGTYSYEHLFPTGSHPLLDPLWSTESLTIEHDGCEANRLEKIARIAQSDIALRSLRVCFENRDDSYNCGRCEKCLRTMLGLHAVGALDRCTTFDQKLDTEAVYQHMWINDDVLPFAEENLKALENSENDHDLAEALRFCINNYKYEKLAILLNKDLNEFLTSTQGTNFVSARKNTIFRTLWKSEKNWLLKEVFKEKLKELDQKFLSGMLRRLHGITRANGR